MSDLPAGAGGSFTGVVDAAGRGLVTIVVDVRPWPRIQEGDVVRVEWRHATAGYMPTIADVPGHECDWRWYGRRPDGLWDVMCVAYGHDRNSAIRAAPKMPDMRKDLPKYNGELDV